MPRPFHLHALHAACASNDADLVSEVLREFPQALNAFCTPGIHGLGGGSRTLLEVSLHHGAWKVAGMLINSPAIVPGGRQWPQEVLEVLLHRLMLEKNPGYNPEATPVFGALLARGASVFHSPLFTLLSWAGKTPTPEVLCGLHALLSHVDLSKPDQSLKGPLAHAFAVAMNPVCVRNVEVGSLGFNRFDGLLPTLLDLLHDRGWRDPEFLRWSTGMCPAVATAWESDILDASVPEGVSPSLQPRVRL